MLRGRPGLDPSRPVWGAGCHIDRQEVGPAGSPELRFRVPAGGWFLDAGTADSADSPITHHVRLGLVRYCSQNSDLRGRKIFGLGEISTSRPKNLVYTISVRAASGTYRFPPRPVGPPLGHFFWQRSRQHSGRDRGVRNANGFVTPPPTRSIESNSAQPITREQEAPHAG